MEDDFLNSFNPGTNVDKIVGMIFGHALGDAVGLQTEYKFKKDQKSPVSFPYETPIRDFPVCDWTSDTDSLVIVMQSLTDNNFRYIPLDIATRITNWVSQGFVDLGDEKGMGLDGIVSDVLKQKNFTTNPIVAAETSWRNSGERFSTNGSLARTSIMGTIPNIKTAVTLAANLSLITHVDPRCVASCAIHSVIIHGMIYGVFTSPDDIDALLQSSIGMAKPFMGSMPPTQSNVDVKDQAQVHADKLRVREEELSQYIKLAFNKSIADLRLDEAGKSSYVLKCIACSVWALKVIKVAIGNNRTPDFKKVILRIVSECGDGNTNAAIVGSVLGAYLGYKKIAACAADWIAALPNRDWLTRNVANYINCLSAILQGETAPSQPPDEASEASVDPSMSELAPDALDSTAPEEPDPAEPPPQAEPQQAEPQQAEPPTAENL
jgi:ADP-ribosylglycohydrolase